MAYALLLPGFGANRPVTCDFNANVAYSAHAAYNRFEDSIEMRLRQGTGTMTVPYSLILRREPSGESAEITYVKDSSRYTILKINDHTMLQLLDADGPASTEDMDIHAAKSLLKLARFSLDNSPCAKK